MNYKSIKLWICFGGISIFSLPLPAFAQVNNAATNIVASESLESSNPHVVKPATKSVAVFKNGMGFFTREAAATLSDGWCYAGELPNAAFGTLAIYSTSADQVVDVVGAGVGESIHFDGVDAPNTMESKILQLTKHKGMLVEIQYRHPTELRAVSGKLISVGSEFVVVEEKNQTYAVPVQSLTKLSTRDLPLRIHVVDDKNQPVEKANLGIAYLRKGISWIPEYTLRILDDETAELTLRGTLVNEAEDLVHCDVNFVVGVPHFVHSDLLSPVSVGRAIRAIGSSLPTSSVPAQVMSQVMNRAAFTNNWNNSMQSGQFGNGDPEFRAVDDKGLQDMIGNLPAMGNPASGDFTVYTKSDLTVRQGERAMVTLFKKKIRYGHQYRWNMPNPIQHELTLQNDTQTPWTTGPCLAISGNNPLSEDLLKYTPVGGIGSFEVTSAINVANTSNEEEISRNLKAHEPSSNQYYDLVTLRGTIKLKSFAKQVTSLSISAPIRGKPKNSIPEAKVHMNADQLRLVDLSSSLHWQVVLKPGEELTLEYEYDRYVSSN